jgi:tetratricopeptide (TPR) repeat protein
VQANERRYKDCIRLAKAALESKSRLSKGGVIEACTRLALAAARLGQENDFLEAISFLRSYGGDRWARSRSAFLRGFQARLNSYFPEAEELFRESYKLSPGDFPTARELAYVCKVRGKLDDAESFARRANQIAPDNPYIIDILLSILLNFTPAKRESFRAEIDYFFDQLKQFGDEDGHSFYTARRAELEMKRGNLQEAAKLIDEAVGKTPHLFGVHALRAQIYLEQKNKAVAAAEISRMQKIIDDQTGERRSGLRQLLEIKASYLAASGSYAEAKNVYAVRGVFSDEEKELGIKSVDYDRGVRAIGARG